MFHDRSHAGRVLGRLAANRMPRRPTDPIIVLALPRGGVPVGAEVARCLPGTAEFDVLLVRKLGVPGREELAFGAISTGAVCVFNREIIEEIGLSGEAIERIVQAERTELERRERAYRQDRPAIQMRDRVVLLVDDGLATGASMIAAVRAVRLQQPGRIVVAVPVASESADEELRLVVDEMICPETPEPFHAVGYWYRNFEQVTDDEVRDLLREFSLAHSAPASAPHSAPRTNG
jgi:putative phosphoribosyl transferase